MSKEDCQDKSCKVKEIMTGEILEACSHKAILTYLKSKERISFLHDMEKYGYELRVVKKGQCY